MSDMYSTPDFEAAFTYHGNDLGAVWSRERTDFRLWAPTADAVSINLYHTGDPDANDLWMQIPMNRDVFGTWVAQVSMDLNGFYYTYLVTFGTRTEEVCDPYARTTGVNGYRAMVIDLASTNPVGWELDTDPNAGKSVTDAVIYELHVRDMSMDASSGIRQKGKYLGIIESGTKTPGGIPTGLDHMKDLGITHLHLLPVYDFGSIDERQPDKAQFNWGYDPVNFNVPEGSYSSDPCHGEVRVKELKQLIQGLHDNGISAVMDVVYNHVFDAKTFCFNRIVPNYFSRTKKGVFSNGSGCGNDTASERSMVRKYIVDSVCYWADEYHFDGFRFDLVGLLDIDTINEIVTKVHSRHPNVIFYGEGWSLDTVTTRDCTLATQCNSHLTPGFAYFNDTIRDSLRGSVFLSDALGYITGAMNVKQDLEACFRGMPVWCKDPAQTVNYASCHDNNTLMDRISLAVPDASFETRVRMNNLAAAFYMTAQGIPFMQAGEEMLRSKPDPKGGYVENSYCSGDAINRIKWNLLEKKAYRETFEYYKGLIKLRKSHPLLRMSGSYEVLSSLVPVHCDNPQVMAFQLYESTDNASSDEMFIIFSASDKFETVKLPMGKWQICVNDKTAGIESLGDAEGTVMLPPISAMILTKHSL